MDPSRRNFHVPLPGPLYAALRAWSRRVRRPATEVAREAIQRWIEERRKAEIEDQLREYVRRVAGTRDDLDPGLERAAVAHLRDLDRKPRSRGR